MHPCAGLGPRPPPHIRELCLPLEDLPGGAEAEGAPTQPLLSLEPHSPCLSHNCMADYREMGARIVLCLPWRHVAKDPAAG